MIDIHSHILPGLDDGARDWEESLAMARIAVNDGITGMIVTPHHKNGRYDNEASKVRAQVELFQQKLTEQGISLEVRPGQEIRVYADLLNDWDRGDRLLTLNESRYILLEFPSNKVPDSIDDLIYELRLLGLVPIIAHPERNAHILERPERLEKSVEQGALSQVTSHALTGVLGRKIRKAALDLCRRGLVHLLATDSHRADIRPPMLKKAWEVLHKEKGMPKGIAETMQVNAEAVWNDREVNGLEPVARKWKWF